jgi:hypothetical protein
MRRYGCSVCLALEHSPGARQQDLELFCDRLLHLLLESSHHTLIIDESSNKVSEPANPRVSSDFPAPVRLQHVEVVLKTLGRQLFAGPILFSRCVHATRDFLGASEAALDIQLAVNAAACAMTLLSTLKVRSALQDTPSQGPCCWPQDQQRYFHNMC